MSIEKLVRPADFPASQKSAYFNAASVALMYAETARTVLDWQADVAENGTLNFDEVAEEEIYKDLHAGAAAMLNVQPEDIAGGSSTTELMTSLAWSLFPGPGKNIISTTASHPSTIYPWQRVARQAGCEMRMVQGDADGIVDPGQILEQIDPGTAVVCLSMVEYRSGQLYDLREVSQAVHTHGGLLVVDGTQALGQIPIDAGALGIDALVSSGYKWLCGPFGIALMYLAPHLYRRLDPGTVGWRSHQVMWDFDASRLELALTAARFEAGTMAYGCALGLGKALAFLNTIGVARILDHNRAIGKLLWDELSRLGGESISPQEDAKRSSILSVRFPGRDARQIAASLNGSNVVVSERGGILRISPHLYNTEDDVERFVEAIKQALQTV